MKSLNCRNCNKKNDFYELFSLGKLCYTGKFPNNIKIDIPKSEIKLVICNIPKTPKPQINEKIYFPNFFK